MSEAPIPIITKGPDNKIIEINIFKAQLKFYDIQYNLYSDELNYDKLKLVLIQNDNNYNKYEQQFNLDDFYKINKYFKMFDSLKNLENDLIEIIKDNNIEITNIDNNEINLKIKVLSRHDNLVNIKLKKNELNEKEKLD